MNNSMEETRKISLKSRFALNRKMFYFLLFLCALLPHILSEPKWNVFLLLCVSLVFGGILLAAWEKKMRAGVAHLVKVKYQNTKDLQYEEQIARLNGSLEESRKEYEHQIDLLQTSNARAKERVEELKAEMDQKLEEVRHAYLEYEDLRRECRQLKEDRQNTARELEEQIRAKENLLQEYQQTIQEQRSVLEKKQKYIAKLEERVRDLMYEIKSLLHLETSSDGSFVVSSSAVSTYDLVLELQKCIEIAENFVGAGEHLRFSHEGYAIDLRRLFDVFREKRECVVFVYSQIEERLLFVSNTIKVYLEISPERFVNEVAEIVEEVKPWQAYLAKMAPSKKEAKGVLTLRKSNGQKISMHCVMNAVSKGPFVDHVIGLFAPK